ncbi:MAG: ABC transporter permease [Prevotella sp.]|nr:ABC transporter permease [Prevotella sp.]
MVIFPVIVTIFFTSMMNEGQPLEMPVGVVDLDNSSVSRGLIRRLNSFQTSEVVARYTSVAEARQAMQRNKIYAFLYIPEGMSRDLVSSRQPKVSFYYSYTTLVSGSLLFRDLKTITLLGSAAVGNSTMTAKGYTPGQIRAFLQPIQLDLRPLNNPWVNYNMYLSNMLIPGAIMLFIFLISAYSIGTELKFGTSKEWLAMANGNIYTALAGKFLPQFLIFLTIMLGYMYYVFDILQFPHPGGSIPILLLAVLTVLSSQAFGIFTFGLFPSLRMSMSVSALWAVLSFSLVGSAFPLSAMDAPIQAAANLFPLRHYYMIYQISIFNGYPLADSLLYIGALCLFIILPLFVVHNIRRAMLEFVYIP